MNPLLVVIPYHGKDALKAKALLEWSRELGNSKPHHCLLAADAGVPRDTIVALNNLAKESFATANSIAVNVPADEQGWPFGANFMYKECAKQVLEAYRLPWLWLEPDAVPTSALWLSKISEAYHSQPRRFMGAFIAGTQVGLPELHMSGVAVYPPDCYQAVKGFCEGEHAFDMEMARYVIPRANETKLIQNHWGEKDLPPTFTPGHPNSVTLDFIKPEAVLFHRCKDDSLISMLRATKSAATPEASVDNTAFQAAPVGIPTCVPQMQTTPVAEPKKRGWPKGKPRKVKPVQEHVMSSD